MSGWFKVENSKCSIFIVKDPFFLHLTADEDKLQKASGLLFLKFDAQFSRTSWLERKHG